MQLYGFAVASQSVSYSGMCVVTRNYTPEVEVHQLQVFQHRAAAQGAEQKVSCR